MPQQAWIRNATVRDNIVMSRSHRELRYQEVIQACALQPDLDILQGGDMTEVGEKVRQLTKRLQCSGSGCQSGYRSGDL